MKELAANHQRRLDEVRGARKRLHADPRDRQARRRLKEALDRLHQDEAESLEIHRQLQQQHQDVTEDAAASPEEKSRAHEDCECGPQNPFSPVADASELADLLSALHRKHAADERVRAARAHLRELRSASPPADEHALHEAEIELHNAEEAKRDAKTEEQHLRAGTCGFYAALEYRGI